MRSKISLILALCIASSVHAQVSVEWSKTYGEGSINHLAPTPDGGIVVAGGIGYIEDQDVLIMKIASDGGLEWRKTYGGSKNDFAFHILPISDGGYLVCGKTYSDDRDVHGFNGDADAWILRLNSRGDTLWTRCFGGDYAERAEGAVLLEGNRYLVIATTESRKFFPSCAANSPHHTGLRIILDDEGKLEGLDCIGNGKDFLVDFSHGYDGGFLLTWKTTGFEDEPEIRIVKYDDSGEYRSQTQTNSSGSYGLMGAESANGHVGLTGTYYWWILDEQHSEAAVFTGSPGDTSMVMRTYGADMWEGGSDIAALSDGFLICGGAAEGGGDVGVHYWDTDGWIFKVDLNGELVWSMPLGGEKSDWLSTCAVDRSGNIFACGGSNSRKFDLANNDSTGVWIVKLTATSNVELSEGGSITVFPNPASNQITITGTKQEAVEGYEVYDALGRLAASATNASGIHSTGIDIRHLPVGFYSVRIKSFGVAATRSLMIVR